jgi:ATP-dependent Lon protease
MSKFEIAPLELALPQKLRIIALNGKPIFPGIFTPIMLTSEEDRESVEQAYEGDGHIGLALTRSEEQDNPGFEDLFQVGTAAKIVKRSICPTAV